MGGLRLVEAPTPRWGVGRSPTVGPEAFGTDAPTRQVPASPARARLPAAVHVAALDYQDVPDVGTRTSLGSLADPF
jgi:hypothetical protein